MAGFVSKKTWARRGPVAPVSVRATATRGSVSKPSDVSLRTSPQLPPRETSIPYYDPSRIFENIKVVTDLRQSGSERGEVQSGDNGILGPSGNGVIAPPSTGPLVAAPGTPGAPGNALVPIALAIAAFVLLGG